MINEPHSVRTITVLIKKELAAYFNSPIAYIVLSVFLVLANWLFFKPFWLSGESDLRALFNLLPWLLLFLMPALTMRSWSEERKSGTLELLLTLPISDWQLVLAKYIASCLFLLLSLALTGSIVYTVDHFGTLDYGPVFGGYLGVFFLGAVFTALGLFASSLTKNQIIAFVITLVGGFLLFIAGSPFVLSGLPDLVAKVFSYVGLASHFNNLIKGVLDTKDLVYFISLAYFFLFLNVKALEGRKWQ